MSVSATFADDSLRFVESFKLSQLEAAQVYRGLLIAFEEGRQVAEQQMRDGSHSALSSSFGDDTTPEDVVDKNATFREQQAIITSINTMSSTSVNLASGLHMKFSEVYTATIFQKRRPG